MVYILKIKALQVIISIIIDLEYVKNHFVEVDFLKYAQLKCIEYRPLGAEMQ